MDTSLIQTVAVYALPVLFAITLHEAAHGYVARYFGDNTAYLMGRVSLNPIRHIDPIGTILMPIMLYFATSGAFLFGYAKPVPVVFQHLRNPQRDTIWVALAGPAANYLMALAWAAMSIVLYALQIQEPFWVEMTQAGVLVNLVVAAFNLFPIPPLDGGRILGSLLPARLSLMLARLEPYGFFIVMGLVLVGVVGKLWLRPVMNLLASSLQWLLSPLALLLT